MSNGITPRYSQSLSDWFSSLSGYGYGGQPGEYDMTPEQLLSQWGSSKIPGTPGYYTYEGILPTYPGFREQYGIQNYLLNLEKMSQATRSARGQLGKELALTGEAPTHGFEEAGVDTSTKAQERKTIADVMKAVIEQENIGRTGAEWNLAGKILGGRKKGEREISRAYQRFLATDPMRRGDCPDDEFGNPQYLTMDNECVSFHQDQDFYDVAEAHGCDIGQIWIADDPGCTAEWCPGRCVDYEGVVVPDGGEGPGVSPCDMGWGNWCPDGSCSSEHIDDDCSNEYDYSGIPNPFN